MKLIITAISTLVLSGCASMLESSIPLPEELSRAANSAFVGQPINNVLLRYGQPDGKVPFGDLTIYQFSATNTVRFYENVTNNTTGRVGWTDANVPYSERTTTRQGYDQTMNCMMRVGVKADGTVHGVDFVGKMGGCQVFMP